MRKPILSLLIALALVAPALAEATLGSVQSDSQPQIAFKLFSNWADNYQADAKKGKAIATGILLGMGAVGLGGAAVTWYAGDDISNNVVGSPMDPDLKRNMALGFGISGAALLVTGAIVHSAPIKDYRSIYADVFQERDPEVREAMAVSVLRYQADKGRERRITSFISSCAVPLVVGLIRAGANVANNDPWSKDLMSSVGNSMWTVGGGVVQLFSKTNEERLYERYLSTRDALYGRDR
jgi:hypothetical protein